MNDISKKSINKKVLFTILFLTILISFVHAYQDSSFDEETTSEDDINNDFEDDEEGYYEDGEEIQEDEDPIENFDNLIDEPEDPEENPKINIEGKGMEVKSTEKINSFSFKKKNSKLIIGENEFTGIKTANESNGITPYIATDKKGAIQEAQFVTEDDERGEFTIEETTFETPPNTKVTYKNGKLTCDGCKIKKFPGIPEKKGEVKEIDISGENMELPGGHKMSGEIYYVSYKKGDEDEIESYEKFIKINGRELKINHARMNKESGMEVYFDGENHKDNSISTVSFGKDNLIINFKEKGKEVADKITFEKDNPYVKIEDGDHFNIWNLEMGEGKIEIQNRDSQGKIPLAKMSGKIGINQDSKRITSESRGELYLWKINKPDTSTSPIELEILDPNIKINNKNPLGNNKLIVDNFNRMVIVPKNFVEGNQIEQGIDTYFSTKLSYNYDLTEKEIERKIGKEINFNGVSEGNKKAALRKLQDYYNDMTPKMQESFEEIEIYSTEQFWEKNPCDAKNKKNSKKIGGCANYGGKISIKTTEFSTRKSTFNHETTHQAHFREHSIEGESGLVFFPTNIEKSTESRGSKSSAKIIVGSSFEKKDLLL